MNWIDLAFIAVIALSVIYSFARGMIRELFSLLALAGGIFLGLKASPAGVQALSPQLASPLVAAMVTFVIVSALTGLVLLFIGSLFAHAARALHLGWADRLLGAAFGFAKGVMIVAVAVLLFAAFLPERSSAIRRSKVAGAVSGIATRACRWLPPEVADSLRHRLNEIGQPGSSVELRAPDSGVNLREPGRNRRSGTPPSRS